MKTFKDFAVAADTGPLNIAAALEAVRAELARPRPLRPQVILVRNVQEAERLHTLIKAAS